MRFVICPDAEKAGSPTKKREHPLDDKVGSLSAVLGESKWWQQKITAYWEICVHEKTKGPVLLALVKQLRDGDDALKNAVCELPDLSASLRMGATDELEGLILDQFKAIVGSMDLRTLSKTHCVGSVGG